MGRSQETYNKKEVRNKKEKKRKEKEQRRQERRENREKSGLDDMIAYVDENGMLTSTPPDPDKKKKVKLEDIEIGVPSRDARVIDPLRKGVVSFFNESKGYGFIKDLETKESVFFHVNNTVDDVKEGNLVSFETERGHKGLTAIGIKIVK
jgi:cold shock CspA family protein